MRTLDGDELMAPSSREISDLGQMPQGAKAALAPHSFEVQRLGLIARYLQRAVNISLAPELEQFAQIKVQRGRYNSTSRAVRQALRLLKDRKKAGIAQLPISTRSLADAWLLWIAVRD